MSDEELKRILNEDLDKNNANDREVIEATKNFEPNPGPLCRWCEFRGECPLFKKTG